MKRYFKRLKELIFYRPLDEVMDTLEQEGPKQALKKGAPFLIAGAGAVGFLALVLALLYAARGTIWKVSVLVVMGGVLWASYLENHKSAVGSAATKAPTTAQYVTVAGIVKLVAKRIGPVLGFAPIYEESDIKAAKDERIVPHGKCWLFKYRFLKKDSRTDIDEDTAKRALQSELRTVLENDNPAGFDKVRFVYGGADECILQVDRITQSDLYIYVYVCYASEDYFNQRKREVEQHDTADTGDIDF